MPTPKPPSPRNDLMWMLPVYVGCWAGALTSMMTSPHGTGNRSGQILHGGVSGILIVIAALIGLAHWSQISKDWKPAMDGRSLGLTALLTIHLFMLMVGFLAVIGW